MRRIGRPKPFGIIVPFGPGSTPDIVARLVGEQLQTKYPNSSFVMENKPGASGNLGTDAVAKAAPDGTTLGVSIGGPLAINTLLFAKLPYDPAKDIAPVTQLVTMPSVLAVNPELGVNTVAELIDLLKKNPGKVQFRFDRQRFAVASDRWKRSRKERRQAGTYPLPILAGGDDRAYSR